MACDDAIAKKMIKTDRMHMRGQGGRHAASVMITIHRVSAQNAVPLDIPCMVVMVLRVARFRIAVSCFVMFTICLVLLYHFYHVLTCVSSFLSCL